MFSQTSPVHMYRSRPNWWLIWPLCLSAPYRWSICDSAFGLIPPMMNVLGLSSPSSLPNGYPEIFQKKSSNGQPATHLVVSRTYLHSAISICASYRWKLGINQHVLQVVIHEKCIRISVLLCQKQQKQQEQHKGTHLLHEEEHLLLFQPFLTRSGQCLVVYGNGDHFFASPCEGKSVLCVTVRIISIHIIFVPF